MIFNELEIDDKNISKIIFSKVFLKNGTILENCRGVMLSEQTVTLATKISGEIANQTIILRSEICALEYGEVVFKKRYYC
ncbi:MAG TPA: hypothetical protein PKY81_12735 [bacterium]|nr:hypothetical protein [bacterium]HPN31814.1 hypothetical protein [bacterium]